MTALEQVKIKYADATLQLEMAQNRFNDAKRDLFQELSKQQQVTTSQEATDSGKG